MKKLTVLLLTATLMLGMLVGCGGSSDETDAVEDTGSAVVEEAADITGDWYLALIVDGEDNQYTLEEYCATQGVDSKGVECTYTFHDDGTVTGAIGGIGVDGTYTFDGTTVTTEFAGQSSAMTYNAENDVLYVEDTNTGMMSILSRVE